MTLLYMLFVGIGGFFGAIARFATNQIASRIAGTNFPVSTLIVNLFGSFLLGFLIGGQFNDLLMLFLGIGFLGSFTTFSTFALESVEMLIRNKRFLATLYQALSYGGGIICALLGIVIARLM